MERLAEGLLALLVMHELPPLIEPGESAEADDDGNGLHDSGYLERAVFTSAAEKPASQLPCSKLWPVVRDDPVGEFRWSQIENLGKRCRHGGEL